LPEQGIDLSDQQIVLPGIWLEFARPDYLARGHRALARLKFRYLYSSAGSRRKPGPKGPEAELIEAILELKRRNPHLGCPKIAEQLAKSFGIEMAGPN
jgi:hypothetical protein